jgi:hypothetical protein
MKSSLFWDFTQGVRIGRPETSGNTLSIYEKIPEERRFLYFQLIMLKEDITRLLRLSDVSVSHHRNVSANDNSFAIARTLIDPIQTKVVLDSDKTNCGIWM